MAAPSQVAIDLMTDLEEGHPRQRRYSNGWQKTRIHGGSLPAVMATEFDSATPPGRCKSAATCHLYMPIRHTRHVTAVRERSDNLLSTPHLEPGERILLSWSQHWCPATWPYYSGTRVLGWGRLWLTNHRLVWKKDLLSFPWWTGRKTLFWRLDELSEAIPSLSMWGYLRSSGHASGKRKVFHMPEQMDFSERIVYERFPEQADSRTVGECSRRTVKKTNHIHAR